MVDEWTQEPDAVDFQSHGYECRLRRGPMGAWCGYVGIPADHLLHGKHYSESVKVGDRLMQREIDVDKIGVINLLCAANKQGEMEAGFLDVVLCFDVHGGITYSEDHEPYGNPNGLWWFGFDCSHSGDFTPKSTLNHDFDSYKNLAYVRSETEGLAEQLSEFSNQEAELLR